MKFGELWVNDYMALPKPQRDAVDEWLRSEGWIDVPADQSPVGAGCVAFKMVGEGVVDALCYPRARSDDKEWRSIYVRTPPPNVWQPA